MKGAGLPRGAAACLAALVLGGCYSMRATESQQLSYRGIGENPCLFGGVTPQADWHCQQIERGLRAVLSDLNRRVIASLRPQANSCQQHVQGVRTALWQRPGLAVTSVFSCPPEDGDDECHVSALVTDLAGRQYVLDNGRVLAAGRYAGSVAELQEFTSLVGGYSFYPPIAGRQLQAKLAPAKPRQQGLLWETRLDRLPLRRR